MAWRISGTPTHRNCYSWNSPHIYIACDNEEIPGEEGGRQSTAYLKKQLRINEEQQFDKLRTAN